MKVRYYILLGVLFLSVLMISLAGFGLVRNRLPQGRHIAEKAEGLPRLLYCANPNADFGRKYRPIGEDLKHSFKLKNIYHETIRIKVAKTSCTCTTATISKEILGPDEEVSLDISWRPPNRPGKAEFGTFIEVQSPVVGGLWVRGVSNIVDRLRVEPLEIDFGEIKPNETKMQQLTIQPPPGKLLCDSVSFSINDGVFPELDFLQKQRTEYEMRLFVSIQGQACKGRTNYSIDIITGDPVQPRIEVPIHANHLANYEAQPAALLFTEGACSSGKRVKIINHNNIPTDIKEIIIDKPFIISAEKVAAKSNDVELYIYPKKGIDRKTTYSGKISVFLEGQASPLVIRYLLPSQ